MEKRKRRSYAEMTRVYNIIRKEVGDTKICNVCGKEKNIEDFNICVTGKDGLRNTCIECLNDIREKGLNINDVKMRYVPRRQPQFKTPQQPQPILDSQNENMAPIIIRNLPPELKNMSVEIVPIVTEGELYGVYDFDGNIKGTLFRNPADAFKEASRLNNEAGEVKYFSNIIKIK